MPDDDPPRAQPPRHPDVERLRAGFGHACKGNDRQLFALLDGARIKGLGVLLRELNVEHSCLYLGQAEQTLWHVAPYLTRLPLRSDLIPWLLIDREAAECAVFVLANTPLMQLRTHFRRYLTVRDAKGETRFFRFYDPRVLQPFLETCSPEEKSRFFGPARAMFTFRERAPVRLPLFRGWMAPKDAVTAPPPDAHEPFALRPEHEERFAQEAAKRYEQRCMAYLRARHNGRLAQKDDDGVRALVKLAMKAGPRLGLGTGRDVTTLAELLTLGLKREDVRPLRAAPLRERRNVLGELLYRYESGAG